MKILVSACLVGDNCKYNGKNNLNKQLMSKLKEHQVIKVCPEILTGLPIPRPCVEIVDGVCIDDQGRNVDEMFHKAVENAYSTIKDEDIDFVVLQSRSPTCGVNQIYDGTFSGKLIKGQGLFAKKLVEQGYKVIDVEDIDILFDE